MTKRILDVGNCGPDHASITRMFQTHFSAEVASADDVTSALNQLESKPFDLIVVNRKLDIDYSDGIDVIKRIKADPKYAAIPIMLVTNYDEHQQAAVAEGALYGFGKLQLNFLRLLLELQTLLVWRIPMHQRVDQANTAHEKHFKNSSRYRFGKLVALRFVFPTSIARCGRECHDSIRGARSDRHQNNRSTCWSN